MLPTIAQYRPIGMDKVELSRYQKFPCQKCDKEFSTYDAWFQHRFEAHPFSRPVLFLGAQEITTPRLVVTYPIRADQIQLANADECRLDGRRITVPELAKKLAHTKAGFFKIELIGTNADIHSQYEISVEIPEDDDIKLVESEFQRLNGSGIVSVTTINQFIQHTLKAKTARRYVDGLSAYLYGILAKDQRGDTRLTQEEGRVRLNEALQNLSEFNRPLAVIITAIIKFHANDFESKVVLAAAPRLGFAILWFNSVRQGHDLTTLARDDVYDGPASQVPLDAATDELLTWVGMPIEKLREQSKSIERRSRQDDWLSEDRTKAKVLAAFLVEHSGDFLKAAQTARGFRHDSVFGPMVERLIAKSKEQEV
jgi:hypothetical protein